MFLSQEVYERYNELLQLFENHILNNYQGIEQKGGKTYFYFYCETNAISSVLSTIVQNQLYEHCIELAKNVINNQDAYYVAIKIDMN